MVNVTQNGDNRAARTSIGHLPIFGCFFDRHLGSDLGKNFKFNAPINHQLHGQIVGDDPVARHQGLPLLHQASNNVVDFDSGNGRKFFQHHRRLNGGRATGLLEGLGLFTGGDIFLADIPANAVEEAFGFLQSLFTICVVLLPPVERSDFAQASVLGAGTTATSRLVTTSSIPNTATTWGWAADRRPTVRCGSRAWPTPVSVTPGWRDRIWLLDPDHFGTSQLRLFGGNPRTGGRNDVRPIRNIRTSHNGIWGRAFSGACI